MVKKLWKKTNILTDVGKCKYCSGNIVNTDSFVSFYPKGHAHYQCMKDDDHKKQLEKEQHG